MPLPQYYNELYVAFLSPRDGRIKGAGICYYGNTFAIVTCAHVLNSAAGRSQTDMSDATGLEVEVRFSQNTLFDRFKKFKAKVTTWGPASAPPGSTFTPRFDVAVLELLPAPELELVLNLAGELRFVADDVRDHAFSCTYHNTQTTAEDIVPLTGTVSHYLPAEGKTTLHTSINENDPFLKPGSSGSPVYSETLEGIAGIADQLIENDTEEIRYAFMVDARRLADFLPDIVLHQPSLKKKSRAIKKYMCDRGEVIKGMSAVMTQPEHRNLFFLWGDDEQEGKAFSKRYMHQFLRAADPNNSTISIEADLPPDISNPGLFQAGLLENISQAAANSNKKMLLKPADDILAAYNMLRHVKNKIFFFKIIDYSDAQAACFEWFIHTFLKAGTAAYPNDLHVIILFEFGDYDTEAPAKREALFKLAGNPGAFPLEDVKKTDIKTWISLFGETEGSPFITKLKELLRRPENGFPMLTIYEQFDEALDAIDDNDKF